MLKTLSQEEGVHSMSSVQQDYLMAGPGLPANKTIAVWVSDRKICLYILKPPLLSWTVPCESEGVRRLWANTVETALVLSVPDILETHSGMRERGHVQESEITLIPLLYCACTWYSP